MCKKKKERKKDETSTRSVGASQYKIDTEELVETPLLHSCGKRLK